MNTRDQFDIAVVGGGLVGASFACMFTDSNLRVALIEPNVSREGQGSFDSRAIALTYSAGRVFQNIGVWDEISSDSATAIRQILVSQSGSRRSTRLGAEDAGHDALGWNVSAGAISQGIYKKLSSSDTITILGPANATQVECRDDRVVVAVEANHTRHIEAKVVVLADGGRSGLTEQAKLNTRERHYRQVALVCNIESIRPNYGIAYEHFTQSGPLALLPIGEHGYAIVWTLEPGNCDRQMQASEEEFLEDLAKEFSYRVGRFTRVSSPRKRYSLKLSEMESVVNQRVVVVGNAAHTVHPVAGQGFNLGLRDVAALAEVIQNHHRWGWDIGSYDVLGHYERWRSREGRAVASFTDSLIQIFSNDSPLYSLVRTLGLDAVQVIPALRKFLLQRTMGLHGRQSRLVTD